MSKSKAKAKAPKVAKVKVPKVPPLPKEKAPKKAKAPKPAKAPKSKSVVLHTRVTPEVAALVKAAAKHNKMTVSALLAAVCKKL